MDDNSGVSREPDASRSDPERISEDQKEFERNADEQRQAEIDANIERLNRILAQDDAIPAAEVQMAQMPADGARVTNQDILVAVEAGNRQQMQEMQQLRQHVGELRQQVQAAADGPACAGIRCKYVTIAMSVIGGISAGLSMYFMLRTYFAPAPLMAVRGVMGGATTEDKDAPIPDNPDIAEIAKVWLKDSEADFWSNMADFVDANKPRPFEEQLLFMQFTADLAVKLLKQQWVWSNPKDKLDKIATLAQSIETNGLGPTYRGLAAISYNDKPLSRVVAADLMSLALTEWWTNNG
ncbi:hypothetical protein [Rhizobium sp. NPDC090279]|uniref:hypothetical protein n=1 Tax=Rhizobium sp. NPDC090279 TaxID=3364499 RepID=UPI00383A0A2F